jgi:hypothetical protein
MRMKEAETRKGLKGCYMQLAARKELGFFKRKVGEKQKCVSAASVRFVG